MFTGIIEALGIVEKIESEGSNVHFYLSSPFTHELKIDQSVAHNGVCLTVVEINNTIYKVTAIDETLQRTNLNKWKIGDKINLERCMPAGGRFDGHIVQGHVDLTATCMKKEDFNGSWKFNFEFDVQTSEVTVEKGSITVNGVSLTVVDSYEKGFSVAIIPYTYEHTNFHQIDVGTQVNIEFDIIGKYVARMLKGYQK
jgi:riboflavin synthase